MITIKNDTSVGHFVTEVDGYQAELVYRIKKGRLYLLHTFVPDEIGGRGVAKALAIEGLEYARDNNLKLMVYCPFVAAYVKHHPEWYEYYDDHFLNRLKERNEA